MEGVQFVLQIFTVVTSLSSVSCINVTERLNATIAEQAYKLVELETDILQQTNRMTKVDVQLEQLTAAVSSLQATLRKITATQEPQTPLVVFEAQYRRDPEHNVQDDYVMMFDNVITNFGDGYKLRNGTFEAPASGVYVFHVKVTPSPNGQVYAYLMVHNQRVDTVNANDATDSETGVTNKIVQLYEGDRVWVVKSNGVTSVRGWAHTKLSGFLLKAT